MGEQSRRGVIMKQLRWWLIDLLSQTLEVDERDAVYGDLTESGETGGQALRDVLGLVVRRQAAVWIDWRPWTALLALVVPTGLLLFAVSARMADSNAIYLWLYANNWDSSLLSNAAFRRDFFHYALLFFLQYLALACWSWSSGFVLGCISRRTILVNGILFSFILFCGEFIGIPRYLGHWISLYRARDLHNNAAVFALTFYRITFPLAVHVLLVLAPALWGIRQGLRTRSLRPLLRRILWTAAFVALVLMWRFPDPYRRPATWQIQLLQLLIYWPLGYWIVAQITRRSRTLTASE